MSDPIPDDLLDRYLSGEATSAERERVEAWLRADPSRAAGFAALRASLDERAPESGWNVEAAWAGVRQHIAGDTVAAASRRASGRWPPMLLRAAAFAAVVVGGWWAWQSVQSRTVAPAAAIPAVVTAAAQRDTVVLPDGSTVILAPASRLLAAAWADTVRAFELSGEAFFSVASDPDRPFRVRSAGAVTEVLGTEFTVRARGTSAVTVAVREGRVSLSRGEDSPGLTISAGQVGRVTEDAAPALLDVDSGVLLSWLDGVLEFDGDRLDVVTAELSRWFGSEVTLADPALTDRRVTGRFVTDSPEQALDALALTLGTTWVVRDGAYVLGSIERN